MPKMQSKIRLFFLLILLVFSLLTGCEFKDIDKDVFVSMIGIDMSDDPEKPYKITLKLYLPTSSFKQSPEPQYSFLTKNGKTLSEAIRLLESYSDKELEFGHSKLIIIGEELLKAEKGKEILDFLVRRPDIQMISWVAAGRPSAEDIVKMVPKGETAAYPALFNYFDENGTESPYIVTTFLFDLRRRMVEDGIDPILPIIEAIPDESQIKINKSLVLLDKKKPYELNSLKTLYFNVISMNADFADFVTNEEGQYFISRIDTINSKYGVSVQNDNKIRLNVDINLIGYIEESKNPLKVEELPYYGNLMENEGEKNIRDFILEMSNEGYDPLGFRLDYKATTLHNRRMSSDEWNEAYKNAEINLTVNASLKSTGSVQ